MPSTSQSQAHAPKYDQRHQLMLQRVACRRAHGALHVSGPPCCPAASSLDCGCLSKREDCSTAGQKGGKGDGPHRQLLVLGTIVATPYRAAQATGQNPNASRGLSTVEADHQRAANTQRKHTRHTATASWHIHPDQPAPCCSGRPLHVYSAFAGDPAAASECWAPPEGATRGQRGPAGQLGGWHPPW